MPGFVTICLIFSLFSVFIGSGLLLLTLGFKGYVKKEISKRSYHAGLLPRISLIVPCKGVDPGFEYSIQSMFDQDYPDFEIIFSTATEDDPANQVLRNLIVANNHVEAYLVHAGLPKQSSEKLNNQLAALMRLDSDTKVLVFADSDGLLDKSFIRRLVTPLQDQGIGATTGFRWYLPISNNLASWLRSVWNAGGLLFQSNPSLNYTFGGAMAVTRDTFERLNIAEIWSTSLSDDISLTHAIRKAKQRIHFVSTCMVVSEEDSTLSQTIEWTSRQTVIARVYMPGFWVCSAIIHALMPIFPILAILYTMSNNQATSFWLEIPLVFALLWSTLVLHLIPAIVLPTIRQLLPKFASIRTDTNSHLFYLLAIPSTLLFTWNTFRSACSKKIIWRGVQYDIKAPNQIVTIGREEFRVR